jgi:DNA-binding MarR family transcriptional regulator
VLLHLPGFALSHLGRITRTAIKDAFAQQGLSSRAHFVLLCLAECGGLSQRELADRIAMDKSDLVTVLDALEQYGHIRRSADPRDRRRHVLAITDTGMQTIEAGAHILDDATATVLSRLTAGQQATLHRLTMQALGESVPTMKQTRPKHPSPPGSVRADSGEA